MLDVRTLERASGERFETDRGIEHALRFFDKNPSTLHALASEPFLQEGKLRRDRLIARCVLNPEVYERTLLWIRPKEADVIQGRKNILLHHLKPGQQRLNDAFRQLDAEGKPKWVIILKARQQGFSTKTAARVYAKTATRWNERALIVGHDKANAAELLTMYQTFHQNLPAWIRPMTRADNRNELLFQNPSPKWRSFDPGLGGRISIETAQDTDAGAGYTVTLFHGSECARKGWANAPILMTTLDQAMPQPHVNPHTYKIIESTAQGQMGWFYDEWQASEKGQGPYMTLFVGFWEEPTYALDPVEWLGMTGLQIRSDLDEKERQLIAGCAARYHVAITDEQLAWRRWMIQNRTQRSWELFDQEYPWCPDVAFLSSGTVVFDLGGVAAALATCVEPKIKGSMQDITETTPEDWRKHAPKAMPLTQKDCGLRVYALPDPTARVVLVEDPSDGHADSDYQACHVWGFREAVPPEQMAVIESKIPLHHFVDQCFLLGKWYEEAGSSVLHIPETNYNGRFVTSRLLNHGAQVYMREDVLKVKNLLENTWGFLLTATNKPKARHALARIVEQRVWLFRDKRTVDQIRKYTVVYRPDGTIEYEGAPRGVRPEGNMQQARLKSYDDLVICAMIMAYFEMDVHSLIPESGIRPDESLDILMDRAVGRSWYDGRRALDPYREVRERLAREEEIN